MSDTILKRPTGPSRRQIMLGAGAGAVALSGIGPRRAIAAKVPDTLRFALSSYPPNLAPHQNTGTAAGTAKIQVFRGLLGYDGEANVRLEVAEDWQRETPTRHTLRIRANAKFHNGDPVTSEDVRHTFEQILGERSTAYLKPDFERVLERVEVVDGRTVRFHLKTPSATFPYLLASWHSVIISHKSPANAPIGCGPYRIANIERGTRIDLERVADFYRAGRPRVPKIQLIAYPDENLRVAALEAGDVDLIEYVPWPNMEQITRNPNLLLDTVDGPFMYLLFNVTRPPFNDVRLRQAVAFAVRREDVVQAAFQGRGSVLEGIPFVPGSPFFNAETARHWRRDLDRSRALLREAGHANGFQATLASTAQYGMHKDTAEVVQQSLRDVGIQVQLNMPDWATRVNIGNRGQYDFGVMGSAGDFNDPDSLTAFLGGGPGSLVRSFGYENPDMNRLLEQGRTEVDENRRKAIYAQVERLALQDAPLVGLSWRSQGYAMQRYVQGFKNMPGFMTFYSGYTFEDVAIA